MEPFTINAGDKPMAALQAGSADIAGVGPEAPICMNSSDSPTKARICFGRTSADV